MSEEHRSVLFGQGFIVMAFGLVFEVANKSDICCVSVFFMWVFDRSIDLKEGHHFAVDR